MVRALLILTLVLALPSQASSRYVAEGAGSPVRWEAWGTRAFERAKKEGRPIFLAVGYASSFESFRMQREAFLNGEIAELMNTYFVPVLLDRLERPELAESYETIARSMTGASGWPLNLILTPSLEPFAAAGFLAPGDLNRMLVIESNRWANEREAAIAAGRANVEKARDLGEKRAPGVVEASTLDAVLDSVAKTHDAARAPRPMALSFLLRYADRTKNENVRTIAADTMKKLAATAVRDQLGGGFHRAVRDEKWQQPYFEKLLADQALLAIAYLEAFQLTGDPELERIARGILDATLRDLRHNNGGFDAAQDAHNLVPAQGPEFWNGAFYVWNTAEVAHLVGEEPAKKVFRLYGMKEDARNVLTVVEPSLLKDEQVAVALKKLLDVRQRRPQPFRESNVVAGLNGLMISALARGGAVLGERTYTDAAGAAARLVTAKLWNAPKKMLSRSDAATAPDAAALSEDYALLVQGLLDLFEAGYDVRWLDLAIALQKRQDELFWDESLGRYTTGSSVPAALRGLLVEQDQETPAVNSVAAMNLLRLTLLVPNEAWRARPAIIFQSFGTRLRTEGAQLTQLASAYATSLAHPSVVVVTGDPREKATHDLLRTFHQRWEPLRAIVFVPAKGAARDRVVQSLPFTGGLASDPKVPLAYSCRGGECRRQ